MQLINRIQKMFHDVSKDLWNPIKAKKYSVMYEDEALTLYGELTCYIQNDKLLSFTTEKLTRHTLKFINKWNEKVWDDEIVFWHQLSAYEKDLIKEELAFQLHNEKIDHETVECFYD